MAPYGFSITKGMIWRGVREEFSNIYHYDLEAVDVATAPWQTIAEAIAAKEKPAFGQGVSWSSWRAFGPTNAGEAANKIVAEGTLSGAGVLTGSGLYPEMAVVVSWFLGRSPTTNRKRFLRKYLHVGSLVSTATTAESSGLAALTNTTKVPINNYASNVQNLAAGSMTLPLCAPNGDHLPLGTSAKVLDYLHIRQLRQ